MAVALDLTDDQRAGLSRLARAQNESARKVTQAKVLLALDEGRGVRQVAREVGPQPKTVMAWRDAFVERGLDSIGVIAKGRGRKQIIATEVLEAIIHDTLHTVPDDESECWTTRTLGCSSRGR